MLNDRDKRRSYPFFGLPGNPVSAFVMFHLFVYPCLRALAGFAEPHLTTVKVMVRISFSLLALADY